MFVLDTDIISNLRKREPHPNLIGWIDAQGWDRLAITAITVMEIQRGIERARVQHPETAERVELWLAGMLAVGTPQVLSLDSAAAVILGRMYETRALRDFLITAPGSERTKTGGDLAVAAIAISLDAVLVTNNVRDYRRIDAEFPLPGLFNPFDGAWAVEPPAGPGPPE
jgi:predicted nucleic acid-binding protein